MAALSDSAIIVLLAQVYAAANTTGGSSLMVMWSEGMLRSHCNWNH